jgi:hypothetical protein
LYIKVWDMAIVYTSIEALLAPHGCVRLAAAKSWYNSGRGEILVVPNESRHEGAAMPLSQSSAVVKALAPIAQQRLYVPPGNREEAMRLIQAMGGRK